MEQHYNDKKLKESLRILKSSLRVLPSSTDEVVGSDTTSLLALQQSCTNSTLKSSSKLNTLLSAMRRHVSDIKVAGIAITPFKLKVIAVWFYKGPYNAASSPTLSISDDSIICMTKQRITTFHQSSRQYVSTIDINNPLNTEHNSIQFVATALESASVTNPIKLSDYTGTFGGFSFARTSSGSDKDDDDGGSCLNLDIVSHKSMSDVSAVPQLEKAFIQTTNSSFVFNNDNNVNDDYLSIRKKQNKLWSQDLTRRGIALVRNHEVDKAISLFDQAIGYDDGYCNADAYVARGAAFANKKRFDLAVADFEKALTLNPEVENAKTYLLSTRRKMRMSSSSYNTTATSSSSSSSLYYKKSAAASSTSNNNYKASKKRPALLLDLSLDKKKLKKLLKKKK